MKIAKKISLIFVGSTLFVFIICILFGGWILKNLKIGEDERVVGRSNSIYSLYNDRVKDVKEVSENLKEAVAVGYYMKNSNSEIAEEEINKNIKEDIDRNDIMYAGIISSKANDSGDIRDIHDEGIENSFKNLIYKHSKSRDSIGGTIVFNDRVYILHIDTIGDIGSKNLGQVVAVKEVNNKFVDIMRHVSGKEVGIEGEFYPTNDPVSYIGEENIPVYNVSKDGRISSYIAIDTIEEGKKVYLTLTEDAVVSNGSVNVVSKVIGLLLVIILGINLITYLIVRNKLIKRITNMNKDVNNIIEGKEINSHLVSDNEGDEITGLTVDINKMIDNIREVNLNLNTSKAEYKKLLKTMSNGLIYLEVEEIGKYKIIEINNFAKELLGLVVEENYEYQYLKGSKEIDVLIDSIDESINSNKLELDEEIQINDSVWLDVSYQLKKDGTILIVLNDITDLKRYSEEMKYLANYDTLTGILNRHNIMNYLGELTEKEEAYTIYFIDLDNFKGLNDTLGHNMGDKVLCAVSEALNIICTDDIKVGRLGGDEFVVVKKGNNDIDEAEDLAQVILEVINSVIRFNKLTFELSGSIGISYYPTHSKDMNEVIQYADIAMYKAKSQGGNNFKIFSSDMLEGLELQSKLKEAIIKDEFVMYYQPIYDIKKNSITGCEALIRWISEDGMIPPDKFIPLAKRIGEIVEIDKLVFHKSLSYCKEILETKKEFTVSVNLSYKFLKQYNFLDEIKEFLEYHKLDPHYLRVEVTEDEFIEDMAETSRILNSLRKMGIRISLDDFGTGYSSFNYLKQLPVDVIKIDRSIVSKVCEDEKSLNIVRTLIKLCHELNFSVICEGVEYEEEFNLLKELSCDKIQGYYISRPVSGDDFKKMIE